MKHSNETVTDRTAYPRLCVVDNEHQREIGRRHRGLNPRTEKEIAASVEERMDPFDQVVEIDERLRATARRLARKTLGAA